MSEQHWIRTHFAFGLSTLVIDVTVGTHELRYLSTRQDCVIEREEPFERHPEISLPRLQLCVTLTSNACTADLEATSSSLRIGYLSDSKLKVPQGSPEFSHSTSRVGAMRSSPDKRLIRILLSALYKVTHPYSYLSIPSVAARPISIRFCDYFRYNAAMASISTEIPLSVKRVSSRPSSTGQSDSRDGKVSDFEGGSSRLGVGNHLVVDLVHVGEVVDV